MSTDTTPHTPTPWYVGGHPCDGSGSDWREILTNALPYQPHFIATALKADAELIVQAVNERESLLAERDALRAALERIMEYAHDGARIRDIDPNEQPQFVAARAALKGGK